MKKGWPLISDITHVYMSPPYLVIFRPFLDHSFRHRVESITSPPVTRHPTSVTVPFLLASQ